MELVLLRHAKLRYPALILPECRSLEGGTTGQLRPDRDPGGQSGRGAERRDKTYETDMQS